MSHRRFAVFVAAVALLAGTETMAQDPGSGTIALPKPDLRGRVTLERAIAQRRSVREYAGAPLTLAEVSQLLWSAQGITSPAGRRAIPSAGALYPLEVFLVAGDVGGLGAGVYRYLPKEHALARSASEDRRGALSAAALGQGSVRAAPAVIVIAGLASRLEPKYRERSVRYMHMEAGAAVQDISLTASALGLGTVVVGAFEDDAVKKALGIAEEPLALMPVGRRK